ncbi:hypothetical protein GCM10020218_007760 [Dactylosporangium vinaceum]
MQGGGQLRAVQALEAAAGHDEHGPAVRAAPYADPTRSIITRRHRRSRLVVRPGARMFFSLAGPPGRLYRTERTITAVNSLGYEAALSVQECH